MTNKKEFNLDLYYASLGVLPQELIDTNDETLTRIRGYAEDVLFSYQKNKKLFVLENSQIISFFRLLRNVEPSLELYHGGDLSYIGNFWSFDISHGISFSQKGYDGQKREHPTIRRMTISDLMQSISAYQAKSNISDLRASVLDIVSTGNDWRQWEIRIPQLEQVDCLPFITANKPPSLGFNF